MPRRARRSEFFARPVCRLLVVLLAAAGPTFTPPVSAQQVWVRAYESVEDLWESYREGEITTEQYRELLGLFLAGADAVFRPLQDLEELPGFSALDSGQTVPGWPDEISPAGRTDKTRHDVRWGYTLPIREETGEEGYLILRRQSQHLDVLVEGQSRDGRVDGFRRRGISAGIPWAQIRITAGNFEPRYGLGLVVGRRDRVLGRSERTRLSGSIWQPQRANYNGIFLQSDAKRRTRLGVFGSRIENADYREDLGGAHVALNGRGGKSGIGLTGAYGRVTSRAAGQHCNGYGLSLFATIERSRQKWEAEAAVANGGAFAGALRVVHPVGRGWCSLTLWNYDPAFILFSSGGPGHPGRSRVSIFENELEYYSRTAGEQGLLLDQRTPFGRGVTVESALEVFDERLEQTGNIEGRISCRVKVAPKISISGYLRGRNTHGSDRSEDRLYVGCSGQAPFFHGQPSKLGAEFGVLREHPDGKIHFMRCEVQTAFSVNRFTVLTPRLRYIDPDMSTARDGYFYAYLTETISLSRSSELEAAVVLKEYEDPGKKTFADVRVRMNWRP